MSRHLPTELVVVNEWKIRKHCTIAGKEMLWIPATIVGSCVWYCPVKGQQALKPVHLLGTKGCRISRYVEMWVNLIFTYCYQAHPNTGLAVNSLEGSMSMWTLFWYVSFLHTVETCYFCSNKPLLLKHVIRLCTITYWQLQDTLN